MIESSDNQHEEEESTDCYDEEDEEEPSASAGKRSASTHRSTRPVANHSDYSADSDGERKIRKSVSLTDLRSANHSTDIAMIKDKHRKEKNFQDKTDKRERARGRRETSREVSNPASVSGYAGELFVCLFVCCCCLLLLLFVVRWMHRSMLRLPSHPPPSLLSMPTTHIRLGTSLFELAHKRAQEASSTDHQRQGNMLTGLLRLLFRPPQVQGI